MPYLPPLTDEQASDEAKKMFDAINDNFGMVPNIFRTLGHNPAVLSAILELNNAVQESDLPAKFRELVYLKSSQINGCDYCAHYHSKALKKAGGSDEQVQAIDNFAGVELFDDQEKAVLRFAQQLTEKATVDRETYEAVAAFLNESQMVALVGTISLANVTNRVNHAFDVELP